jgi:hypothetical protein
MAPGPGMALAGTLPRMIMPSTSSLVTSSVRAWPTTWPFFITRDAVCEVEDVVDVVADQEDADAVLLQLFDELADLRRFLRAKRGRRLVHDQDAGIEEDGARNRHRLALAAGQRLDRLLEALEVAG